MKARTLAAALLFAAAAALGPAPLRAQEGEASGGPRAHKLDEFGRVGGCDHGARLDHFAIELMNNPDAAGYVIAYGPTGEGSGTAHFRLEVTKDYMVNTRGINAERLQTVNGGPYKTLDESFVELWVAPPGAEPPRAAEYRNDADKFKGKFAEYEAWDSFAWDEALGPPVGNSRLAGFADVLKLQPAARAYLVAFNSEGSAPGAWRRVAEREAEDLKRLGLADRVRIIFGGYGKKLTLQLWALPEDAPPPAKDAGPERKPPKAVRVGRMDHYQLRYEDDARSFFRGFAEVLKADESLTAHLVIRLPAPEGGDALAAVEPDPSEPRPVDAAQLAEKWKEALRKEYGVGEQRLVVQVVPPENEWSGGETEVWVVPAGAAPPDPYAEEEEEVEEAAEGHPEGS